jgi:hypothetical protein
MNRLTFVAVTMNAIVFVLLIPFFELNSSHLTNPLWPSHARLHEAWQLLTNAAIAIFALRLALNRRGPWIAIALCLIPGVSFLIAWATSASYGGSMLHSDGTQMAIAGINVAVLVVAAVTSLLVVSAFREKYK